MGKIKLKEKGTVILSRQKKKYCRYKDIKIMKVHSALVLRPSVLRLFALKCLANLHHF